jgi:transcriptional regulator with XRE-family HTH domain
MRGIAGISERLKRVRQALGKTQGEIAEEVGAKQRSWQEYEAGQTTPGSQVIAGLARLGFDANWILTGIGQMRQPDMAVADEAGEYTPRVKLPSDQEVVSILQFRREWLDRIGVPAHELVHTTMRDNSMEPTVREGALVVADGRVTDYRRAGLYLVQQHGLAEDHSWLTVIRVRPGRTGQPAFSFDNQEYSPGFESGETEDLMWRSEIQGRVIWIGNPI